jgi:sulfur-oxidizing protein SoxX
VAVQKTKFLLNAACGALLIAAGAPGVVPGASAEEIVAYEVVDGVSIAKPLTEAPGDAVRGREVAINRKQGNCLACHILPIPEQPFHGEVGPDLSEAGSAYSAGELRLRIVNPKVVNPDTIMPAFYRTDGFHRVTEKFQGKSILTAQQVEDVIAYLMTLKSQ